MKIQIMHKVLALGVMTIFSLPAQAAPPPPIEHQVKVNLSLEMAWQTWTTKEGLESFLGREVVIDANVDGLFVVNFLAQPIQGTRGTGELRVLAVEPEKR